ncbi:Peptidyl-prolyl cis-trans isomerase fpr2, variant 3 [Mucor circinelloides]
MIDILRQSPNCRKRVTSDASIQLQYVAKTLESDDIIDKKIIDLNPGEMTVVKGLEHEILGMCIGEIRRLVVPAALHVSNDGQIASKAMIYDIEVLKVDSAPLLTPVFWLVIGSIAVAYVIFSRLSAMADIKKDKTQ